MMTITKHKDGRRITGYSAEIGEFCGPRQQTPAAAKQACQAETVSALSRLATGTTVVRVAGIVCIVSPSLSGWDYRVIHSDGAIGSTTMTGASRDSAIDAVSQWAGQLARHDDRIGLSDDEILASMPTDTARAELRRYFQLQDETTR